MAWWGIMKPLTRFDTALMSIKETLNQNNGNGRYKLSIVGGGSKQKLVNIAHKLNIVKHIKFEGPLARNQIFNWIDSLDILIHPSRS